MTSRLCVAMIWWIIETYPCIRFVVSWFFANMWPNPWRTILDWEGLKMGYRCLPTCERFLDFVADSRPSKHGIPWFPVVGDPCDPESSGLLSAGFPSAKSARLRRFSWKRSHDAVRIMAAMAIFCTFLDTELHILLHEQPMTRID